MLQQLRLNSKDLSLDIWIHVMYFLKPMDIIRMRRTCRFFHQAISHRTVWLSAVKTMGPSTRNAFPVDRMDKRSLEYTALAPARFSALMKEKYPPSARARRGPSNPLEYDFQALLHPIFPDSARFLLKNNEIEKELAIQPVRDVLPEHLWTTILGAGRFLLTLARAKLKDGSSSQALFVQLWDLGTHVLGNGIHLLKSAVLKYGRYESSVVHPLTGPPGLYMFLLETVEDERHAGSVLSVYTFTLFDSAPVFELQNEQYLAGGLLYYCTDGSRIAALLNHAGKMCIWNWEDRTAIFFDSGLSFSSRSTYDLHWSSMLIYEDNLLMAYRGCAYQWCIPDVNLAPQSELFLYDEHEIICPHRSVQYASHDERAYPSPMDDQGVIEFLSWTPNTSYPLKLLVVKEDKLVLYDVAMTPSLSETSHLRNEVHVSVNTQATLSAPVTSIDYNEDADICEGHLTFSTDHRGPQEAVVMYMIPLGDAGRSDVHKQFLLDNPADGVRARTSSESVDVQGVVSGVVFRPGLSVGEVKWTYLSPWTGRACYTLFNGDCFILEYLKPPRYDIP